MDPQKAYDARRPTPLELYGHAEESLRRIRETMEGATAFTALSGRGALLIGLTGLAAAGLAAAAPSAARRLTIWLAAAAAGTAIGVTATLLKARRLHSLARPIRKFALNLAPPLLAGALLTLALARARDYADLPALWLLLYGVGMLTGGAFSVRPIPALGIGFMALGGVALLAPATWGNALLAGGFGGLHLAAGVWILWRYGG